MTVPAPQPYPGDVTSLSATGNAAGYRRTYRDPLGRVLNGHVQFRGENGRTVDADVTDGTVTADLPPGTYQATADLTTIEGVRVTVSDTITTP